MARSLLRPRPRRPPPTLSRFQRAAPGREQSRVPASPAAPTVRKRSPLERLLLSMTQNRSVAAAFTLAPDTTLPTTYILAVSSQNGGISCNGSACLSVYNTGTTLSLLATPSTGYTFVNWGGDISGTTNPTTLTMTGNKSVSASFVSLVDTTPPSKPQNLVLSAARTAVTLNWTSSTDPTVANQISSGLSGYRIYRAGVAIDTVPSNRTFYTNTQLTPDTSYTYQVEAYDTALNNSPLSDSATVMTTAPLPRRFSLNDQIEVTSGAPLPPPPPPRLPPLPLPPPSPPKPPR